MEILSSASFGVLLLMILTWINIKHHHRYVRTVICIRLFFVAAISSTTIALGAVQNPALAGFIGFSSLTAYDNISSSLKWRLRSKTPDNAIQVATRQSDDMQNKADQFFSTSS